MSRYYKTDEEKKGYAAWDDRFHGKSYYDGGFDYQRGWEEHKREEARELEQAEEDRKLEELDEARQFRKNFQSLEQEPQDNSEEE